MNTDFNQKSWPYKAHCHTYLSKKWHFPLRKVCRCMVFVSLTIPGTGVHCREATLPCPCYLRLKQFKQQHWCITTIKHNNTTIIHHKTTTGMVMDPFLRVIVFVIGRQNNLERHEIDDWHAIQTMLTFWLNMVKQGSRQKFSYFVDKSTKGVEHWGSDFTSKLVQQKQYLYIMCC